MTDKNIQERLEAVRQSYIASMKEKQEAILNNWNALVDDWTEENFESLYIILHGLAGSAETFGFPEVTQNARSIVEQFKKLKAGSSPDSTNTDHLDRDIKQFVEQISKIS